MALFSRILRWLRQPPTELELMRQQQARYDADPVGTLRSMADECELIRLEQLAKLEAEESKRIKRDILRLYRGGKR